MRRPCIAVRGGGDLGSACAVKLIRCGFNVIIAERERPLAVRRTVSFSEAVYDGAHSVEGIEGVLVRRAEEAAEIWRRGAVPVLIDPEARLLGRLQPDAIVDATLRKKPLEAIGLDGTARVGLGPGFIVGGDVDAVVETNRGPDLGRVLWSGSAQADSGTPAPVLGHTDDRVLRAPVAGRLQISLQIGEIGEAGIHVAKVEGRVVLMPFRGLVRGLLRDGAMVEAGMKIGDVDPRVDPTLVSRVSDKGLAVAGGVLEAVLVLLRRRGLDYLLPSPPGAS